MFLNSLLEVSAQATNVVKWISVGAVVALLAVVFFIGCTTDKKTDATRVAIAGVCVATSFTLAILKISPIQYGGSITLASFAPILVYAYCFGPANGFTVGLIHGLLNFIEDPYILTPVTFLLDYLLPFASVGVMGFFGKMQRKEKGCAPVVLGCACVFTLRFLCHLCSGMIFFLQGAVWVSFPDWAMGNAFTYSLIYQCIYVPADAVIATLVMVALCKSGFLDAFVAKTKRLR